METSRGLKNDRRCLTCGVPIPKGSRSRVACDNCKLDHRRHMGRARSKRWREQNRKRLREYNRHYKRKWRMKRRAEKEREEQLKYLTDDEIDSA